MSEDVCVRVGRERSLEDLRIETCPVAEPGVGEVRVRLRASSLNYADFSLVTGLLPNDAAGMIPLTDGAGVIEAVGTGVTQWRVGDDVMARFCPAWNGGRFTSATARICGGMSEDGYAARYTVKPASWFVRVPTGYSHAEAATLGCAGLTAWRALFVEGALAPGQWVLTQGTGGVSTFALQFAKAAGARVIATTGSEEKAARLHALGADHVLNYKEQLDWGEQVFALADGRGADVIVEVAGGPSLSQSIEAVREGGIIALIGVLAGWRGDIPTVNLLLKNARIQGLTDGNLQHLLDMIDAIETHGIRPVISDRYPLERLADAFRQQVAQTHFGKIVIDI